MVSLKEHKESFAKVVETLKTDLKSLRTGRANSALVDHITIDVYGQMTPLQHVASVSVPDNKTILISPWDKSNLKEIEKAIVVANIGLSPVNDGVAIRLNMPAMTEEHRKDLLKVLKHKLEAHGMGNTFKLAKATVGMRKGLIGKNQSTAVHENLLA